MELTTRLEIKNWDEKPHQELPTGEKFARAQVTLLGTGDGFDGDASADSLLYYRPDGTSTFVGLYRFSGTLDGRPGTFVVESSGTYDGTTATVTGTVVPGSGTGELAGLTGRFDSASTHGDYPHMPVTLTYDL
jgi:hypothetical protein